MERRRITNPWGRGLELRLESTVAYRIGRCEFSGESEAAVRGPHPDVQTLHPRRLDARWRGRALATCQLDQALARLEEFLHGLQIVKYPQGIEPDTT